LDKLSKLAATGSLVVNQDSPDSPTVSAETELQALTEVTVTKVNAEAECGAEVWIAIGKAVMEFVDALRTKGYTGNPYQRLADHPQSLHKESQLRNYEGSYKLWMELGGDFNVGVACAIAGDLYVASVAKLVADGMTFEAATVYWLNGVLGCEAKGHKSASGATGETK
jgi:hypothetical protein